VQPLSDPAGPTLEKPKVFPIQMSSAQMGHTCMFLKHDCRITSKLQKLHASHSSSGLHAKNLELASQIRLQIQHMLQTGQRLWPQALVCSLSAVTQHTRCHPSMPEPPNTLIWSLEAFCVLKMSSLRHNDPGNGLLDVQRSTDLTSSGHKACM
jgi:hypothetical protein